MSHPYVAEEIGPIDFQLQIKQVPNCLLLLLPIVLIILTASGMLDLKRNVIFDS